MDTLVFLCQHTCTMVLPRWGAGLSSEVCDAAVSSSDSASTAESSGHSGKVRKLLLLKNSEGDEGENQSLGGQTSLHVAAIPALFSPNFDTYFIVRLFSASWKRVRTTVRYSFHLCSNLLLPVRLLVRRSDESPLVVFAISMATLMSSIHFCISARELECKTKQLHSDKIQDNITIRFYLRNKDK